MFSIVNDQRVLEQALKLCRGCYQEAILLGHEAISGSTLHGLQWGRCRSAMAILGRCQSAGLPIKEIVAEHGKRVLVIG